MIRFFIRLVTPLLIVVAVGCAPKVSTTDLSAGLATGCVQDIIASMENDENSKSEMWHYLNLGRLYQNEGNFTASIGAFEKAEAILIEYEERAKVSMRNIGSGAGSLLFSKGTETYYGKGYERTLMHTLNAFNYLLTGDVNGAAIEMRKMEKRQEFWLEESSEKIKQAADKQEKSKETASNEAIMEKYSMRSMLEDPVVSAMINNYQDPFSYSLSSMIATLNNDASYAEVSARRASSLDENAKNLLAGSPITSKLFQEAPPKSESVPDTKKNKKQKKNKVTPKIPVAPEARNPFTVTVVALTGRAPSLKVENIPIPIGHLNYTTIDLPALNPPSDDVAAIRVKKNSTDETVHHLLHSERMAYKTLKDEMPVEIVTAIVRAASKGAAAYAATKAGGDLGGLLASVTMNVASTQMELSYRNWELLPNSGFISSFACNPNDLISVELYGRDYPCVQKPDAPHGVIYFVSALSENTVRISHAVY